MNKTELIECMEDIKKQAVKINELLNLIKEEQEPEKINELSKLMAEEMLILVTMEIELIQHYK